MVQAADRTSNDGTGTATSASVLLGREHVSRMRAHVLVPLAAAALFALVWDLLCSQGIFPSVVPRMESILSALGSQVTQSEFWSAAEQSLTAFLISFGLASLIGISVGIAMGLSSVVDRLMDGLVELLRPVPGLAYLPFVILYFGASVTSTVIIATLDAIWQILKQTAYGMREVDPLLRDTGRVYGLTWRQRLRVIVIPGAAPSVATGLRLGATVALLTTIGIEVLGTGSGLGGIIYNAEKYGQYSQLYALGLAAGILGLLINGALALVERRALFWSAAYRSLTR
jgi:ABC-type nitrate/sulfonate/bicarbonate transport system permease component